MLSIYIHIPFCKSRCFYCDFTTFAGKMSLIPAYIDSLKKEISITSSHLDSFDPVYSIYFGGGTPSILEGAQIQEIISTINQTFTVTSDAEITLEANPADLTQEKAAAWKAAGINRVSLGMQSSAFQELKAMGRHHSFDQTAKDVQILRNSGIQNFSLDLIYGYPGQTLESWKSSLAAALSLQPKHISLYGLSIESGAILKKLIDSGKMILPDEDLTAEMFHTAESILAKAGFIHYEISNWAAEEKFESRHNLQYWKVLPYLGFGVGASGNINHKRTHNCGNIEKYNSLLSQADAKSKLFPAADEILPQTEFLEMQDFMMLGLRMLNTGANPSAFKERFNKDFQTVFSKEIHHLMSRDLVKYGSEGQLILNQKYTLVANQAFMEFVD